jgi:hypothetical protein
MVERLQLESGNVTDMTVNDAHSFTLNDQPSRRSAYYLPAANLPTVCVSNPGHCVPGQQVAGSGEVPRRPRVGCG